MSVIEREKFKDKPIYTRMALAKLIFIVMEKLATDMQDVIISLDFFNIKQAVNVSISILHDEMITCNENSTKLCVEELIIRPIQEIFSRSSVRKHFKSNYTFKSVAFKNYNNDKLRRYNIISAAMIILSYNPSENSVNNYDKLQNFAKQCGGTLIDSFHLVLLHYLVLNRCCIDDDDGVNDEDSEGNSSNTNYYLKDIIIFCVAIIFYTLLI
jgi:hypothetical protein